MLFLISLYVTDAPMRIVQTVEKQFENVISVKYIGIHRPLV